MTRTAILSALIDEQRSLIAQLENPSEVQHAGRRFWCGRLHGQDVVLALSRIGKVAAATTATALVEKFQVGRIVFTGVAGGLAPEVRVGDLVLATDFLQHDLDSSPIVPRYEVPLYGRTRFAADATLNTHLRHAATEAFAALPQWLGADTVQRYALGQARIHQGLVASGDRFVSVLGESQRLQADLLAHGHTALAVEMEGAAVAQVCFDYGVPFAAVRTISDRADATAHADFTQFVRDVASHYAEAVLGRFLRML